MSDTQETTQPTHLHQATNQDHPPPSPSMPNSTSTSSSSTAQPASLPVIDISPFLDPSASPSSRLATAQALNAACLHYGFFYLTGHGIPVTLLDEIIDLARRFFALPLAEKMRIKRFDAGGPEGGDSARGYQAVGENVSDGLQDLHEAIDWYAEWPREKREAGDGAPGSVKALQGENLWPERPVEMRGVYEGYVERVKVVGRAVVHAMGLGLGLGPVEEGQDEDEDEDEDAEDEEIFLRKCKDSFWVMRAINYPPLPLAIPSSSASSSPSSSSSSSSASASASASASPPSATAASSPPQFSCGAHTDYGCITLLLSDPTPSALQVQLRNGTWLNADPIRGAFVVNIGDMIERWTNGLWKSTLHRVIHRGDGGVAGVGGGGRISVPFFYEPGFEVRVQGLQKCGGAGQGGGEGGEQTGGGGRGRGTTEDGTYGEHLLTKVFSNFYYSKRTDW